VCLYEISPMSAG